MNDALTFGFEENQEAKETINGLASELLRTYDLIEFPAIRKGVLYEYASVDDIDDISHCLSKTFVSEPKQKCIGLTYNEMKEYVNHHVAKEVANQRVMVARDIKTKKILGAETWQDLTDSAQEFENRHPKFAANYKLWKYFNKKFTKFYQYVTEDEIKQGDVMYIRMAAVDIPLEEAAEKKIGNYFYHFNSVIAYKRGYKAGFAIESGPISQYLAMKFGSHIFDSLYYKDFEFEGKKIFENINFKSFTPQVPDSSIISVFRFKDPIMMIKTTRLLPKFISET